MALRPSLLTRLKHSIGLFKTIDVGCLAILAIYPVSLSASPLNIQAQEKITCHHAHGICEAFGNVHATQGKLSLFSDKMRMAFSNQPKTIQKLLCAGHVRFTKEYLNGSGGEGTYEASTQVITLSKNPLLTFKGVSITSQKPMHFNLESHAGEIQQPHVVFPKNKATLTCNTLTFYFSPESKGSQMRLISSGDVLFATPDVVMAAHKATYDTRTQILHISGNVKILDKQRIAFVDKASYHLAQHTFFWEGDERQQVKGMIKTHIDSQKILPHP